MTSCPTDSLQAELYSGPTAVYSGPVLPTFYTYLYTTAFVFNHSTADGQQAESALGSGTEWSQTYIASLAGASSCFIVGGIDGIAGVKVGVSVLTATATTYAAAQDVPPITTTSASPANEVPPLLPTSTTNSITLTSIAEVKTEGSPGGSDSKASLLRLGTQCSVRGTHCTPTLHTIHNFDLICKSHSLRNCKFHGTHTNWSNVWC